MQTTHGTLYYRTPAGEVIDLGDLGGGVTVSTKAGELPTDAGQSGDEFINITDQRQFIFTGLSWVERPYPPMDIVNIRDWTDTAVDGSMMKYAMGDLVIHNGAIYRALQDTIAAPGTDETMWTHVALYMGVKDVLGIGRIDMFPVLPVPSSHLVCDGSKYDKMAYPELFDYLKTDTLPDLRNEFIRGWSAGRAPLTKENWSTGFPRAGLRNSTDGSHQHATAGNHRHVLEHVVSDESGRGSVASGWGSEIDGQGTTISAAGNHQHPAAGSHTHTITGGDAETRPANVALVYAIQATAIVSMENPVLRAEFNNMQRQFEALRVLIRQ